MHTPTALELAGTFITVLREVLSEDDMRGVLEGRLDVSDLCDDNEIMAEAFKRLHGRDPWLPSDWEEGSCTEAQHDADLALWNGAADLTNRFLEGV